MAPEKAVGSPVGNHAQQNSRAAHQEDLHPCFILPPFDVNFGPPVCDNVPTQPEALGVTPSFEKLHVTREAFRYLSSALKAGKDNPIGAQLGNERPLGALEVESPLSEIDLDIDGLEAAWINKSGCPRPHASPAPRTACGKPASFEMGKALKEQNVGGREELLATGGKEDGRYCSEAHFVASRGSSPIRRNIEELGLPDEVRDSTMVGQLNVRCSPSQDECSRSKTRSHNITDRYDDSWVYSSSPTSSSSERTKSPISFTPTKVAKVPRILDDLGKYPSPNVVAQTSPPRDQPELELSDDFVSSYFDDAFEPLLEESTGRSEYGGMGAVEIKTQTDVHSLDLEYSFESALSSPELYSAKPSSGPKPWTSSQIEPHDSLCKPDPPKAATSPDGDFVDEGILDRLLTQPMSMNPGLTDPVPTAAHEAKRDRLSLDEISDCNGFNGQGRNKTPQRKRKLELMEQAHAHAALGPTVPPNSTWFDSNGGIGSLDSFLHLKAARRKKIEHSTESISAEPIPQKSSPKSLQLETQQDTGKAPSQLLPILPPRVGLQAKSETFVVSTTLLAQRSLIGYIRALYPGARWIEVDFSLAPPGPYSAVKPTPASMEPDLLLSPDTALLLTSLIRLHQQPLPGTTSIASIPGSRRSVPRTPLYARVERTIQQYGCTIVLITQGLLPSSPSVAPSIADEKALRELRAFVEKEAMKNQLSSTDKPRKLKMSRVEFAPGGEKELAHWAVSMMAEYGGEWEPHELRRWRVYGDL